MSHHPRTRTLLLAILTGFALLAAACGGDDDDTAAPAEATSAPAEDTADAEEPGGDDADDEPAAQEPTATPEPEPTATPEPTPEPIDPLLITTSTGPVQGAADAGIRSFLAIPYAEAPVGDLRWTPPVERAAWTEPFDGTVGGVACPQGGGGVTEQFLISPEPGDDCLSLSVWAPEDAAGLPVMVWIHGGGLSAGSAHLPLYDGADLATEGVVVVGINYRVGAAGFMAHPDLAAEDPEGRTGNYGIMDQQLALQWVQQNIAGFGGDAGNVTLFGQSAGGFSICAHLANEASDDLYQRVILMSGGGCVQHQSLDEAYAATDAFVAETSCAGEADTIACLRGVDVSELVIDSGPSALVGDGVFLDAPAINRLAQGELNDISIMTGSTIDEFNIFAFGAPEPTEEELIETVTGLLRSADAATLVLDLYPSADYATQLERLIAIQSDAVFTCSAALFAQTGAAAGADVWRYIYVHESAADPIGLGAAHGVELPVLFTNPTGVVGLSPDLDPIDAELAAAMQTAWVSFATDGKPLAPEIDWPATSADAAAIMEIGETWTVLPEVLDGRCGPAIQILVDAGVL